MQHDSMIALSIPVGSVPSIPQWIMNIYDEQVPHEYQTEGMSKHYIYRDKLIYLRDQQQQQIQVLLKQLMDAYAIKVDFSLIFETFKVVNALVGNPLSKAIFDFKIKAIYGIFQDYPAMVFDHTVCKELATLTPFFPSAHDIEKILSEKKKTLDHKIAMLRGLLDHAKETVQSNMVAVSKKLHQDSILRDDAHVSLRLCRNIKIIDQFIDRIQKAVENYVPDYGFDWQAEPLIQTLQDCLSQTLHPKTRQILTYKIESIRSAQCQIAELKRLGIL